MQFILKCMVQRLRLSSKCVVLEEIEHHLKSCLLYRQEVSQSLILSSFLTHSHFAKTHEVSECA